MHVTILSIVQLPIQSTILSSIQSSTQSSIYLSIQSSICATIQSYTLSHILSNHSVNHSVNRSGRISVGCVLSPNRKRRVVEPQQMTHDDGLSEVQLTKATAVRQDRQWHTSIRLEKQSRKLFQLLDVTIFFVELESSLLIRLLTFW